MLPFARGLHPLLADLVYLVTPPILGHPETGEGNRGASAGSRLLKYVNTK